MNSNNGWLEVFLDDKYDKQTYDKFCLYENLIETNEMNKYYEEFIVPQMNIETRFKNFKVKKLVLETNSNNIYIKYDDDKIYCQPNQNILKKGTIKKNEFQTQIVFEPYILDEKKFSLPIATFTTI